MNEANNPLDKKEQNTQAGGRSFTSAVNKKNTDNREKIIGNPHSSREITPNTMKEKNINTSISNQGNPNSPSRNQKRRKNNQVNGNPGERTNNPSNGIPKGNINTDSSNSHKKPRNTLSESSGNGSTFQPQKQSNNPIQERKNNQAPYSNINYGTNSPKNHHINQRKPNNANKSEKMKDGSKAWGKHIAIEETYEDIKKENERIEKEIWLEIASIHTTNLD